MLQPLKKMLQPLNLTSHDTPFAASSTKMTKKKEVNVVFI